MILKLTLSVLALISVSLAHPYRNWSPGHWNCKTECWRYESKCWNYGPKYWNWGPEYRRWGPG
ncbi:MAG TPA: hypothetical protein EYH39_00680, partial [Desulfurobacteriaceae bacterium]|nr:hypothetical protein [Desulfurobacteriaceae bacterium]